MIKTQGKPQPFPPGDLELGQPFRVVHRWTRVLVPLIHPVIGCPLAPERDMNLGEAAVFC